jgi:hypothetical protein
LEGNIPHSVVILKAFEQLIYFNNYNKFMVSIKKILKKTFSPGKSKGTGTGTGTRIGTGTGTGREKKDNGASEHNNDELRKLKIAQDIYEKFIHYEYNQKLRYLKSNINFINSKLYCGWYAQMLNNYISDAKTDYGPFIQTFGTVDIDRMLKALHRNQCPKNIYGAVTSWLTRASQSANDELRRMKNAQDMYEKFILLSHYQKLKYLKSNINFMNSKIYCGWYAQMLNNYISDAKTDYGPFIQTFGTVDIDRMLKALHRSQCPKNIYNAVTSWLTRASQSAKEFDQKDYWPKSRDELCKLNKLIDGSTVNIIYSHGDTKSNNVEDIAGIFTHEIDAIQITACLNKLIESGNHTIVQPFKVVRYKIGTVVNGLSQYMPNVNSQKNNVYIVYRIIKYKSVVQNMIFLGINYSTSNAEIKKYRLNTVIPFVNSELYCNTLKKVNIHISYLDNLGIKYTAWDNHDNTAGTCLWHAFSKALGISLPEIGEIIKQTFGESKKELYNKLLNYKIKSASLTMSLPECCEIIPNMTKNTGVIIFYDDLIKKSSYAQKYRIDNAMCYFPKHPKKVIFTVITYMTYSPLPHALVLTLNGKTLDDNWSENISDVKDELLRILPKKCHEMLT